MSNDWDGDANTSWEDEAWDTDQWDDEDYDDFVEREFGKSSGWLTTSVARPWAITGFALLIVLALSWLLSVSALSYR
ncbi:MAG: hypothetical protein AAGJ40_10895 [Planctomycetota bacterium]